MGGLFSRLRGCRSLPSSQQAVQLTMLLHGRGTHPEDLATPEDIDLDDRLEGYLHELHRSCTGLSQLELPPAATLLLSSIQRQLDDLGQVMSEVPGQRHSLLGSLREPDLSPREFLDWNAACPGGGNLLQMVVCMAYAGGGDSEKWMTGRLSISDMGLAFDSGLFNRVEVLCTGLVWWSDVVDCEILSVHVGGAEVVMSFHEEAEVGFRRLRLHLGTVGKAVWLREVWKVCKAPQGIRRSTRRVSTAGVSEEGMRGAFGGAGDAAPGDSGSSSSRSALQEAWQELAQRCRVAPGRGVSSFNLCARMADWQHFDIFELTQMTEEPLALVGVSTLVCFGFLQTLGLPLASLYKVVSAWERGYKRDLSFHNSIHAADVTHAVYHTLVSVGLGQYIPPSLSIAMLTSSMFHDVGHPGVDNRFLVATNDVLAIRYNDRSPLENMHCATGFEILRASGVDLFGNLDVRNVRKHIMSMVLATDMSVHHVGLLELEDVVKRNLPWDDAEMQDVVSKVLVHISDIGSPTRPYRLYEMWSARVMEEFFRQADLEREMKLCFAGSLSRGHLPLDRRKPFNTPLFQLGFARNVVLPTYEVVSRIPDLDFSERVEVLQANLQRLTKDAELRAAEMASEIAQEEHASSDAEAGAADSAVHAEAPATEPSPESE